ncbi:type II toxin-antitoxin system HicB family antitoxin [Microcoleus sp. FACHB-831]|uniref:type II toxin-antitoxin system HicB family antitoxin n=1 Tax=Microcoleus sp. FACHB-831 TaxID=2692827 RepID=UPI00281522B4|nr:type II toxin-antitoxin system HicB family antitoxin [Microcoleus sp. FACHB-831]
MPEFSDRVSEAKRDLRCCVSADRVVMPCTHGKTREEAIHNGEEVIDMYLEAWQAEGESIPEPSTLQIA